MAKRVPVRHQLLWGIGIVSLVIVCLAIVKFLQIRAAIASSQFAPPPEAVTAAVVKELEWQRTIRSVGSLAAVQGVTLSAETAGVVTKINFESGTLVKQGDVIVELDASVEEANLKAAQAVLASAEPAYNRARKLFETKATSQAELETAEATVRGARAAVASLQAQIEKKAIKAPFSGRLGIRTVNLGEYVNPGSPVIPLHDTSSVFADFSVPQAELQRISIGNNVRLKVGGIEERVFEGTIRKHEIFQFRRHYPTPTDCFGRVCSWKLWFSCRRSIDLSVCLRLVLISHLMGIASS